MNLLLLSCSRAKRSDPGAIPAYERYDGPTYRVLRNWMRQNDAWPGSLRIRILSAEYGLIGPHRPIADYDRLMTRDRAGELHADVAGAIERLMLDRPTYDRALIVLGATYRLALPDPLPFVATWAEGRPGERLAHLKTWLGEIA